MGVEEGGSHHVGIAQQGEGVRGGDGGEKAMLVEEGRVGRGGVGHGQRDGRSALLQYRPVAGGMR